MLTKETLIKTLKEWGIDITKHRYELRAEEYERYDKGATYTYRFTAPGDWVALYAMYLHSNMTMDDVLECIDDYWGGIDEIPEDIKTLKGMENHASSNWWGDGDDYIISLKNLDTGKYIYCGDEEDYDYEEEDDWGEIK